MIPAGVIQIRRDICGDCATPCANLPDAAHPCSACPLNQWGQWGACNSADTPAPVGVTTAAPLRGLGDLVAKIAEPIAAAIGLDKSKCGCAKRQATLNRIFPFKGQ